MRYLALIVLGIYCLGVQANDTRPTAIEQMPPDPVADAPARLIFSRDNNAPNACDVELYVNQQVVARLGPGEQTSLDLPSGELSIAVALSPDGYCGGRGPEVAQSVLLRPGETRQFAVVVEPEQVFLAPVID
ncbi:Uncharacterised protein [Ectopseudomonas mendocina]|jgi:hypothetical protein|uniref:Uncharacterized protein n=1 Tax=Ectopseudomonas mendocina TaxID=300 RepID=A0A379IWH1_ECTME|nr:hypothetical protein [Pseudomonas mendocina]AEB58021.1 hypothetical protein MDS_1990 [Pseudomonas mendocina NK-01]TRO10058.1 hypothetical protein EQ829_22940 [Pseudomonas mendocina]TRO12126.1 hypothetical protein EQ836_23140 [Pseudomonas mendocina]SUD27707.1 Uncharacterised protein [Pseudomonas mendocina]SUD40555.1 Uncharacterised protein [Pseudomonas mendocina]